MTLERKITTDLSAGQATLANLCANVEAKPEIVAIVLARMESAGTIYKATNNDGMTVFRLSRTN